MNYSFSFDFGLDPVLKTVTPPSGDNFYVLSGGEIYLLADGSTYVLF